MPGYCKVSTKTGGNVINQQAIRIDFATAWTGIVCTETEHGVLTTEKATNSLFPHHKVRLNSHTRSPDIFGRARGKHANSHIICSTQIISCEKCKLNPCLKKTSHFPKKFISIKS